MGQKFSDYAENNYYVNIPRWSGYSTDGEDIVFGAGETDPAINANWKSPSANVVSDTGDLLHSFDYTTNPGSVTYIGTQPIIVDCHGIVTASSSVTNTGLRFQWAKNGTTDVSRFLFQNIGNANDAISLPSTNTFTLVNGDYLDFFFSADKACTIGIDKAEWQVRAISTDWTV